MDWTLKSQLFVHLCNDRKLQASLLPRLPKLCWLGVAGKIGVSLQLNCTTRGTLHGKYMKTFSNKSPILLYDPLNLKICKWVYLIKFCSSLGTIPSLEDKGLIPWTIVSVGTYLHVLEHNSVYPKHPVIKWPTGAMVSCPCEDHEFFEEIQKFCKLFSDIDAFKVRDVVFSQDLYLQ